MIYQGSFNDYNNTYKYRVTIIKTDTDITTLNAENIIDPTENTDSISDNLLYFSPDPVHLTCDRSDLTQLIMISQCQIKLKVNQDLSEQLFANTDREIKVIIEREYLTDDTPPVKAYHKLFYGYVDPLQFNQSFAHNFDEITINATDPLGALEQLNIGDIDVQTTDVVPVINLMYKIFEKIFAFDTNAYSGIQTFIAGPINPNLIKVNVSVFFGDSEDDYMSLYDVLNELLKYLGCTISYEPEGGKVHLFNIYNGVPNNPTKQQWFDGHDDAMDDSTTLSKDDAYSKVTLTCEIEPNDDEINLLDDEFMFSDYSNYQKYMTELVSPGEGWSAINGFGDLIKTGSTEYEAGYKLDHYCYVKRNNSWDFGKNSYITNFEETQSDNTKKMVGDQSDVLRWLKNNTGKAAFVSFGKGNKINYNDNSPVNNISLTDYLVISVNGHNDHGKNGHIYTMMSDMQRNSPICKYNGLKSVNLTPTDESITNYIVISGKMILNPLQRKTGPIWEADRNFPEEWHDGPGGMEMLYNNTQNTMSQCLSVFDNVQPEYFAIVPMLWHKTVPHPDNGGGAYYQQQWWNCTDPRNPNYTKTDTVGIYGFLDNKENEMLKYTYTTMKDNDSVLSVDKISKLPILACQLKIGDKYCVERLDLGEEGQGIFQWMTYDEWSKEMSNEYYNVPYFTIGIDPKVDDKIVGHSFSIQNNIKYTMNVDGTGTAIPIKITDKLNGTPEFTILGVLNQQWDEVERVHPTMFRHTSYNHHKFWTLELLDSILISDLKIEFKSDNALYNEDMTTADNDLVYYSDTNINYTEKLECDLKICTPLTIEECQQKGIKYQTSNSYVMTTDDEPFYGWKIDQFTMLKPERLFVDYYYKQYYRPARKISFNVDNGDIFGTKSLLNNSHIGFSTILSQYAIYMEYPGIVDVHGSKIAANYYCMSMDWSIKRRENEMTVREVLPYDNPFS